MDYKKETRDQLLRAGVVVSVRTENTAHSHWVQDEVDYARRAKKLIYVEMPGAAQVTGYRAEATDTTIAIGDDEELLRAIRHVLSPTMMMPSRPSARNQMAGAAAQVGRADVHGSPQLRRRTIWGSSTAFAKRADVVDATAFCPRYLRAGESELVQIVVHLRGRQRDALRSALKADKRTSPAAPSKGLGELKIGDRVSITVDTSGASVEDPPDAQVWSGEMLTFAFRVVSNGQTERVATRAVISVNGVFVGRIIFSRTISKKYSLGDVINYFFKPRLSRFKRVFFSYSSRDRDAVKVCAKKYESFGISFFQDVLDLDPGERWARRLWTEIDRCDLFVLFWSTDAMRSEWVIKEADRAWRRQARNGGLRPTLRPEILENPPPVPQQDWLREFHFNDSRFHGKL